MKKSLTKFGFILAANLLVTITAGAEVFTLLETEKSFIETGADNSLVKDKTLFSLQGNKAFITNSDLVNIHAHYRANSAAQFKNYTYTGMMRIMDSGGGVGVTFYSDYPNSDTYYRLRMFSGGSFHIAPHPDSQYTLTGSTDTGVTPEAEVWQKFKIIVKTFKNRTTIKAKVWAKGTPEPSTWLVDCVDQGDNRIKKGKPGVWSMATGQKQWKQLKVTVN